MKILQPFSMDDDEKVKEALTYFDEMTFNLTSDTHQQILFLVTLLANIMSKHLKPETTDAQIKSQCENLGKMIGQFMVRSKRRQP